jgi:hypothetical protein
MNLHTIGTSAWKRRVAGFGGRTGLARREIPPAKIAVTDPRKKLPK